MEYLLAVIKMANYLLYNHGKGLDKKHRSDMIGLISLTDQLIEEIEILEGTVTIEEINAAAKTLAPKMQSSFDSNSFQE